MKTLNKFLILIFFAVIGICLPGFCSSKSTALYRNNMKNRFWAASALPQNFCLHSRLALGQWSLAPDKNFEEPPCRIPDSSCSFGIFDETQKPSPLLLELLQELHIPHDCSLDGIVKATQEKLFQKGKERWLLDPVPVENEDKVCTLLQKLICSEEIPAQKQEYEYGIVLGALISTMQHRIDYLIKEWKRGVRFKKLVFLTGARPLDPSIETFGQNLRTETEGLIDILENTPLPQELKELPFQIIDTPMQLEETGLLRRPNTADTVKAWLKTHPKPGTCLIFSNPPYLEYQDCVLRTYLPSAFTIETIGPRPKKKISTTIYLDTLTKWLYQEKLYRQRMHEK